MRKSTPDLVFLMFCHRGARVQAGRVQGEDQLARRGARGSRRQQPAQREIFSCQVSSFTPRRSSLESQIFAREQLGRGRWCRSDSGLASDDPRLLSLHERRTSFCSGACLEKRSDLQSRDAGRRGEESGCAQAWPVASPGGWLQSMFPQFPPQVPLFDFFTGVFTLFELVVQEERTQVAGVVMVLDCKGFGLSHVR